MTTGQPMPLPSVGPRPDSAAPTATREALIHRGMRFVAGYLQAHDYIISHLMRALGPMPANIDPRTVAREVFLRLRKAHLIRKCGLTDSPRRGGGYTGLWTFAAGRSALADWMEAHPPDPAAPPTVHQWTFTFMA